MATIHLGRLGFVNKGTYNNSTTYEKNDLVQFTDGGILSTYLYIDSTAQSGQAPSSSGTAGSRWVYFAKGVADAVASAGNNKVLVTDGSGSLSPLSIGSTGQLLKVTGTNTVGFAAADPAVLRKVHNFRHSTRVSIGTAPGANINAFTFSGTFTPVDATNNSFYVNLTVPTNHGGNDFGSHGVRFDGSSNTYDFNLRGVKHIDVGGPHMSIEGQSYIIAAGEMAQQSFTLRYRYYEQSSSPDTVCVNTSDNSRVGGQTTAELIIFEYKNA